MKIGTKLLASLEADLKDQRDRDSERMDKVYNGDMDLSDCFLSVDASKHNILNTRIKIEILKNQGLSTFEKLTDLDGNIIEDAHRGIGQYGVYWRVNGGYLSVPSFGNKAGKEVWVEAGFKNHADAKRKLYDTEEGTDAEREEKLKLYWSLGEKAEIKGYEAKGYRIVSVQRPAWVSDSNAVFESRINYFTGESND